MTSSQKSDPTSATLPRRERYALGRVRRKSVPRESHANWRPPPGRDPLAILAGSNRERIPDLLPIRQERMLQSPFTFLRGAAAVMAVDLAGLPKTGLGVQACGDCHLMNFGVFATPEERVLFDINDFDETLPGVDFTTDLKRLAASVAVAARDAGFSDKKACALARDSVKSYREFMRVLGERSPLEVWHTRMDIRDELKRLGDDDLSKKILSLLVKAKKDLAADDNFPHLATAKGPPRIEDRPPLIYHFDSEAAHNYKIHARKAFSRYQATLLPERRALLSSYVLADIAFKVVGIGSVGTFCAIGLFMTADGEPLFLQVKQALVSVLEKLVPRPEARCNEGERVVEGQRAMQAASDIFLGWTSDEESGRDFYIRQLKNRRLGSINEILESQALGAYANLCGRTLARAHARTADPALLAGYMGKSEVFDEAVGGFAMAYAEQSKQDHDLMKAARPNGHGHG